MTFPDREAVRAANPLEQVVPELLGGSLKGIGRELAIRCPWHDDNSPSLRINPAKQVWCCDVCACGGDVFEFVMKARGCDFLDAKKFLEHRAGMNGHAGGGPSGEPEAIYTYRDLDGAHVQDVLRYPGKVFRQRIPDGHGGFIHKKPERPVVYRLNELRGKTAALIVEGEKDCDRAWSLDLTATTSPAGAKKWRDEYTQQLVASGVQRFYIIPDDDEPGREHAEMVARSCNAAGLWVRIVTLPGVPAKGDLSDYLDSHSKDDLSALLVAAREGPPYRPAGVVLAAADQPSAPEAGASWLAPPEDAAFSGLAGDIVRAIEPHTEADPVALLANLLVFFSNAIGSGPHCRVGAQRHLLTLYAVLVGKSAKARKGASQDPIQQMFLQADPEWAAARIFSGLSSGEGLINLLREPGTEEDGVITVTGDKRALITEAEFARVLKVMSREHSTLSSVLREAWDGKDLNVLTRNDPLRAKNPHISVIAHITLEELIREFSDVEAANGFGNRFLWFAVKRAKLLPNPLRMEGLEIRRAVETLSQCVRLARGAGEMARDADAAALWDDLYRGELATEEGGLVGSLLARAEPQVMRLSALYALLDGDTVVRASNIHSAMAVWRYVVRSVAHIFGESLGDPVADRIWHTLRDRKAITRTEINNLFQGHERKGRIDQALGLLETLGRAMSERRDTSGRPVELWKAV